MIDNDDREEIENIAIKTTSQLEDSLRQEFMDEIRRLEIDIENLRSELLG